MPRARPVPRLPLLTSGFAADQWQLLVQLPAEVMIAAIAAQDGAGQRRTVAEGLAGLDAIAAGRASDSDLVRAVVAAIYAEPEPEPGSEPGSEPDLGAGHEAARPPDRAQMLADCRRVADLLRAYADPADAAAYRHWVQQVAVRVCLAARSQGVFGADLSGPPGHDRRRVPATSVEGQLLADLASALA